MKPIQVTKYETEDGLVFDTEKEAIDHEKGLNTKGILESLNEAIKKMEIPLNGKTPELVPLSYYIDAGCSYASIYNKLKAGNFRYFMLKTSQDAERLAAFIIARKQAKEGKEVKNLSDNYDKIDEMLDETRLDLPCVAFISDYDFLYGDSIGTFLGETEIMEGYCKKNGYNIRLEKTGKETPLNVWL